MSGMTTYDWLQLAEVPRRFVIRAPGGNVTLTMPGGSDVVMGQFAPWEAGVLAVDDWFLIQVKNPTGSHAVWLADAAGCVQTYNVMALRHHSASAADQALADRIADKLRSFIVAIFTNNDFAFGRPWQILRLLGERTVRSLARIMPKHGLIRQHVDVTDLAATPIPVSATTTLDAAAAARALDVDWASHVIDAVERGALRWPAISQPGDVDDVVSIPIHNRFIVLRCTERKQNLVWYVLVSLANGKQMKSLGLFFPTTGALVTRDYQNMRQDARSDLEFFLGQLFRRFWDTARALAATQNAAKVGFALILRPPEKAHLGHYICNDMSIVDRLVHEVSDQAPALKRVYVLGSSQGLEFYGPLENIFPELEGRIDRAHATIVDAGADALANRLQPLVVQENFVTNRVRQRLLQAANLDPNVSFIKKMERDVYAGGKHVDELLPKRFIVLGLRLQDRTLPDLTAFYCLLMERLLAVDPDLGFVIDGLNTPGGGRRGEAFRSFTASDPARLLLTREDEAVERIRRHFESRNVRIVDCVGSSMCVNLFWIARACMFVAPHGGGLAKYRWAANLPGYVLTSAINLRHSGNLRIYDGVNIQEDPAAIAFTETDEVKDLFSAGMTYDHSGRSIEPWPGGFSSVNFEIDRERVLMKIIAFFDAIQKDGGTSWAAAALPCLTDAEPVA
ncbi:hypothetical protein C8P66_14711 [Humitalea rosea]|uniref:Uncharacterized protein n=1 Tax=Humitalea rosea TaxID=990373 RepID=A0A2W7IFL5_9PROT|nr:hypothetical protein [Humitalea rosea]PZW37020.1 hypothetical protein C8P66_14711 [Humitalea rosea]